MCANALVNQPNLPTATAFDTLPRLAPMPSAPFVMTDVIFVHNRTEAADTTARTVIPAASPRLIGSCARPR